MNWHNHPRIPGLPPREFLLLASYCGDDNPKCRETRPCADCLAMCNIFNASGDYLRQLGEPCFAQADRSPKGQDGETRLDRNDESAVAESDAPKGES